MNPSQDTSRKVEQRSRPRRSVFVIRALWLVVGFPLLFLAIEVSWVFWIPLVATAAFLAGWTWRLRCPTCGASALQPLHVPKVCKQCGTSLE